MQPAAGALWAAQQQRAQGEAAQPAADAGVGHGSLHQPYSRLLVCEAALRTAVGLSSQLCTDLADLHSQGSCAVQVSVEVHPSGWDASEDCRAYVMQRQPVGEEAGSMRSHSYGPFEAKLQQRGGGRQVYITALCHDGQLAPFARRDGPHTLVLQERVSCDDARCWPDLSSAEHLRDNSRFQQVLHAAVQCHMCVVYHRFQGM